MGEATEEAVRAALQSGGSAQVADGSWRHDAIEVAALTAAADECEAFPWPTPAATLLANSARLIIGLRTALKQVDAASVTTWGPLASVLASLPPDDLALSEVRLLACLLACLSL